MIISIIHDFTIFFIQKVGIGDIKFELFRKNFQIKMDKVNDFIQNTYQKDINEVMLIQSHCSEICNSLTKFRMKSLSTLESKLSFQNDDTVPGVPGTFQNATEAVSKCFLKYSNLLDKELMNLWTSLSSQFIQFDDEQFKSHQKELTSSVNKFNQLKSEVIRMSSSKGQILSRFNKYTSKIVNSESKEELAQFKVQFDEIVKSRNPLAKRRNAIIKESQECLDNIRQESTAISDIFTEYNTNAKNYYQMFYDFFTEMSQKLHDLTEEFKEPIEMMDSKIDFKNFIDKKKIVRADIGFEFIKFDTSSPAFAGCKTCPKVELTVDFPIGMAKVIKDYNADGENEASIRKGKNILLIEFPEKDWCYIMKPFIWSTGFVPSDCIQRIGTKFGSIKGDKLPKEFGESGDFVTIINEDEFNYFLENLYGQQISAPKESISLVFV